MSADEESPGEDGTGPDDALRDPNRAVDYLLRNAGKHAAAKATRLYLQEFRKTKKALLMGQSPGRSAAEREQYAYAHPDYLEVLAGIRAAVELEETLHWALQAAQARIDIWKTQSYNNRAQDRAMR